MRGPNSIFAYLRSFKDHMLEAFGSGIAVVAGLYATFVEDAAQIVAICISVMSFFVASYKVWSRERQKVVELEANARPRLRFGDLSVESATEGDKQIQRALIKLHNDGDQILERCLVKMLRLSGPSPDDIAFLELPVDVRTRKQADRKQDGNFTLRPGQAKDLILAEYYPEAAADRVVLHYEHKAVNAPSDKTVQMELTAYSETPASQPVFISISIGDGALRCWRE
jgi:hypothetical protein